MVMIMDLIEFTFDTLVETLKSLAQVLGFIVAILFILFPIALPVWLIMNYTGNRNGVFRNYIAASGIAALLTILPLILLAVSFFVLLIADMFFFGLLLGNDGLIIMNQVSGFYTAVLESVIWWFYHWYLAFREPFFWVLIVWALITSSSRKGSQPPRLNA